MGEVPFLLHAPGSRASAPLAEPWPALVQWENLGLRACILPRLPPLCCPESSPDVKVFSIFQIAGESFRSHPELVFAVVQVQVYLLIPQM